MFNATVSQTTSRRAVPAAKPSLWTALFMATPLYLFITALQTSATRRR